MLRLKNWARLEGRRRSGGERDYEQIVGGQDRARWMTTLRAGILERESGFSSVCWVIRTQGKFLSIDAVNVLFIV